MFMVEVGIVKFILPVIFFCMLLHSMFARSKCQTFQPQRKQKKAQITPSIYFLEM